MSGRSERLLKGCAISFFLLSLACVSVSIYPCLHENNITLANLSYSALNATERSTALAGLLAAALTVLLLLQLLVVRYRKSKERLQRRDHQLESLARSNQRINENLEVPTVIRTLVEAALELTGASDGGAGLFIDGRMVFTDYLKGNTWLPIDFSFPPGYGVPGWVVENKRPYLSNDSLKDPQVIQEIREQLGFYNLVDTPILNAQGELLGCFEIHNTRDHRPFDQQDVAVLKGLSASAAIAIENARALAALKESEDHLRESNQKFRSLFENSPISLWEEDFSAVKLFIDDLRQQGISDLAAFFQTNPKAALRCVRKIKVLDINQTTVELFAARSKTDLLSHLDQVFNEASFEPFLQGIISFASGQTSDKRTGISKTLNGENLEINIHASILPGHEDSWQKIIVSMTDITREREIDRLKNEFISTAAHELRTPLTVIMGYSDLMLEHLEKSEFSIEQKKEFLSSINQKVLTLERIVEDLLDVNKIESGRPLQLKKTRTCLADLLEEVIRNHQRETTRHRIRTDFHDRNLRPMIDAGRIIQVLNNLLNNAIKYSPAGGNIDVRVALENGRLDVAVEDHGLGLSEDQADRVFDKFYRVDTSNTAIAGLGLGLSIAQNIVAAHGGQMRIESTPGQGTTVSFSLPGQEA